MKLELLTANLWGLPWPISRDRHGRKRAFHDFYHARPFHVVGLQELWWPWRRRWELDRLHLPLGSRDSGLALGTTGALVRPVAVRHFDHHRGPDRLKRKGVLEAALEVAGHRMEVYVTHLQAGKLHAKTRARQVRQLIQHLSEDWADPVVLMGDFNLYTTNVEDRETARLLSEAGFRDVATELEQEQPTYWSSRHPDGERFDRMYVRDGKRVGLSPQEIEVVEGRQNPWSDHAPLRTQVRVDS